MKNTITFSLNGAPETVEISPHLRLIDLLRDHFRLTGTKEGCAEGECGACTVIIDGKAYNSCLYPAMEVDGRSVTTIEGLLGPDNALAKIQQAFVESGGIQCGFCSPGMIMSTKALLDTCLNPTEEEIRTALIGNLCRCTGYVQILEAVKNAAKKLKEIP